MKGVFIPEITVEMLKSASLEAIEDFFSAILDGEATIFDAELPTWIPCSERLPDKPDGDYEYELDASLIQAEEYIVMIKDADIPTTLFWTGDKWFEPCDGDPIYYSVVAWMPLPKSYRKDGE